MSRLHLPAYQPFTHKKKRVFRQCNGYFMYVRCADCEELTICYSHTQTNIKCKGCSSLIVKSTGGKSELVNKAKSKKAECVY